MKDDWDIFDNEIQKAMIRARRISQEHVKPYIKQLTIYKRALKLACKELDANSKGLTNARFKIQKIVNDWCIGEQMSIFDFFLQQAKKEREEQDVKN